MKIKLSTFAAKYSNLFAACKSNEIAQKLIDSCYSSPKTFEVLDTLYATGSCRPCRYVGRTWRTSVDDRRNDVRNLVVIIGDKLLESNDAPRGGLGGELFTLA